MPHVAAPCIKAVKASWCPRKQKKANLAPLKKDIRTNPTDTHYPILASFADPKWLQDFCLIRKHQKSLADLTFAFKEIESTIAC